MQIVDAYLHHIQQQQKKSLAVLIDPDDGLPKIEKIAEQALVYGFDLFLVGGSLITQDNTFEAVKIIKDKGGKFAILFPGNELQIVPNADAILFMSLISGRNPEYLIGKQVAGAMKIKQTQLETLATGYMLIDGGNLSSAHYMSHTLPIPNTKPDIAAATALAGSYLGMKYFYMDCGSGAKNTVSELLIEAVKESTQSFLFVGGGIRTASDAERIWKAGADCIVVGNAIAENPDLIKEFYKVFTKMNEHTLVV